MSVPERHVRPRAGRLSGGLPAPSDGTDAAPELGGARRRLAADMVGIVLSAAGFGVVYGLAARTAGYSPIEASAMSVFVFAGAAQFAAVGMVAAALPWPAIVLTTALINARHFLYGAALRPWLARRSTVERAAMAHVLTDEAFALALVHFRRLGRADARGYWLAAIGAVFIPWNLATLVGAIGGQVIPDPRTIGLDVVFPAAMAGLAVALMTGRREIVAAVAGAAIAIGVGLVAGTRAGIVAGGLGGPFVGLLAPVGAPVNPTPLDPMPTGHSGYGEALEGDTR